MTSLKDRLLEFIEHLGIDKATFEKRCNLSNGFVDKSGDNTRTTSLDKISNTFPELNIAWLKYGAGKMLQKDNTDTTNEINIPYEFIQALFAERKKHDEKEMELIKQNRELIAIIKKQMEAVTTFPEGHV